MSISHFLSLISLYVAFDPAAYILTILAFVWVGLTLDFRKGNHNGN